MSHAKNRQKINSDFSKTINAKFLRVSRELAKCLVWRKLPIARFVKKVLEVAILVALFQKDCKMEMLDDGRSREQANGPCT